MEELPITDMIFDKDLPSVAELEAKYPPRDLPDGAMVTRFCPSPTGFLHIGGVYMSLICQRFAHQSGGVFFLRLEDTDQKRRTAGAEAVIDDGLASLLLTPDEGGAKSNSPGSYGSYIQSHRSRIYQAFMLKLYREDKVYPCFCSEEELDAMREEQTRTGERIGYYGKWARCRTLREDEVKEKLESGHSPVLRLKSSGNFERRVIFDDMIKGRVEMPENDIDAILLKSGGESEGAGLPVYHFAFVVDDYLMRTTHIIRADEWFSSMPLHLEIYRALGIRPPKFAHPAPIQKLEGEAKRKLSKRRDPEANIEFFIEKGYPPMAVLEYLLNLANSDFEDWRKRNPDTSYLDFPLTWRRLAASNGPVFDEVKLRDISKEVVASMAVEELFENTLAWTSKYDQYFHDLLSSDGDYWRAVFGIERDNSGRKDLAVWSEVYAFYQYFDMARFEKPNMSRMDTTLTDDEVEKLKSNFVEKIGSIQSGVEFMDYLRGLAPKYGLAVSLKEYRSEDAKYRGHVGILSQVLRYALTGRENTPDLWQIVTVLGISEVRNRLRYTHHTK